MSYILEALKKADQERNRGEVPDISAAHAIEGAPREGRRLVVWLIAGLILVNLLALYLYRGGDKSAPPTQPAATTDSMPAVQMPESVAMAGQPAAPLSPVAPPAQQQAAPLIVLPPPAPRTVVAAAPAPSPEPASRVVTAPMEPIGERDVLSVPTWQHGSAAVQQLAAGLSLDVHVYADQPAQRFVLINMSKYREGDELREGALLERITAQGVVLSYRGERFRYDKP